MIWPILFSVGLALFIGGRHQFEKKTLAHFDERVFPVSAADWLIRNPQSGNMFNDINWGGYLLYRLWPEHKVFLDSQTDFFGEELVKEYDRAILAQEGWRVVLEKNEIEWAILPPSAPLTDTLQASGWSVIFEDKTAVILKVPQ